MKKDLLICIAYHCADNDRVKYLNKVLLNIYETYKCSFDIIIDSNEWYPPELNGDNIKWQQHKNLSHPFHLTQMHRQHFKDNIDNYENFMYIEDDMKFPYENYLSYLEKFKFMYPKYIPSFIRIEYKDGQEYVSDVPVSQNITADKIISFGERRFFAIPFPFHYHAFWVMPQKELKESLTTDFTKLDDSRERAATYPMWELKKIGLVEIELTGNIGNLNYQVKQDCYSYHLPNNYALNTGDFPNGKLLVKDIFK